MRGGVGGGRAAPATGRSRKELNMISLDMQVLQEQQDRQVLKVLEDSVIYLMLFLEVLNLHPVEKRHIEEQI